MTSRESGLERAAFWLTAGSLGLVQFKLMAGQTLFGLAAICWIVLTVRREGPATRLPRWFTPLLVYAALTIASALGSDDRAASLVDCKQLVLFLLVPIVARVARGDRAMLTTDVVLAFGSTAALVGVFEYYMVNQVETYRPTGFLSHYMTYSGILMLVACTAAARLLFDPRQIVWPAIGVPAMLVALAVTQTRNAWVGFISGLTALLAIRRMRLLLVVPVLVGIFFALAPEPLRHRAYSIIDRTNLTGRDRIVMLQIGRDIIRDHPWLGVGPDRVKVVYARYREKYPDAVNPTNPHLHNVPVQIAAERGLPALAAWLWFIGVLGYDLARQLWRGPARAIAGAGFACVIAMLGAGLFEYNFGDSEFLMLFLGLVTLPHAARQDADAPLPVRGSHT